MLIHEAIRSTTQEKPFIARKIWDYPTAARCQSAARILPTDSPDGCIVLTASRETPCPGWMPTAGDLLADDWHPVGL